MEKSKSSLLWPSLYCVRQMVLRIGFKFRLTIARVRTPAPSRLLLALLASYGVQAHAQVLPTGGQVASGGVTIGAPAHNTLNITQTTNKGIINWQSFNVGSGETVNFLQPGTTSSTLNRVVGSDPSSIFGQINATGQVFLVNNSGIYFAPGSQVNAAGLVASTLSLSDRDFLAGNYSFSGATGTVDNQGVLKAGFVALAGTQVSNTGSIIADGGTAALAAGSRVTLDLIGSDLVAMSVDASTAAALVRSGGIVQADGGRVLISASAANALLDTVINVDGLVQAHSIGTRNGVITINGGDSGVVSVSGTLDASGKGAGQTGGTVKVTGADVGLFGNGTIDASGDAGGGLVRVGGDWHGAGADGDANASQTIVSSGSVINANAITGGNGGNVVLWSQDRTQFYGTITATGGRTGGNGGALETSSHDVLQVSGSVDLSAPHGVGGTWLLDPYDLTISSTGPDNNVTGSNPFTSNGAASVLTTTTLNGALTNGTTVNVNTGGAAGDGNGNGDITVTAPIAASTLTSGQSATLNLNAQGSIIFTGGSITASVANTSLNVNLNAGTSGVGPAGAGMNPSTFSMDSASSISTGVAGNLTITTQGPVTLGTLGVGGNLQITSNGGAVSQALAAANNIVVGGIATIAAGAGNISLGNTANAFNSVALSGNAINLVDANALTVTSLTNGPNGAVTLVAGGPLDISALTGGIATGAGNLTLTSGTTLTTPGTLSGNNVALTGASGLNLTQNVTATGTLGLTTTNAAITQTAGTITAAGATTVAAGAGNVSLADPTNDFSTISLAGGVISVQDANGLAVTSLANGPNDAVTLVAGGLLDISALTGGIATGTGNLTLSSGTTLTTPGALSGSNLALTGASGLNLTQSVTATGALGLTTTNAAITQTAGTITATGATTVAAGTGNVSLADPTNDFSTISLTGGAISVRDANALTVTSLASVPGQVVSVIAGGALGVPASINTGTASLTLTSGALLTTSGTLSGNNVALTGTGGLSIGNNVTATGTLGLTTTNAAITQTAGTITATGATTVAAGTGNVSLADPTNDFSTISLAGNAISVQDANALTVTSLTNGTNGAVTLVAGGLLDISVLTGGIATGTGNLTLSSGTTLTTPGPLTGNNVALTGAGGLSIGNNVTATGTLGLTTTNAAITQTAGTITAAGATTVAAGTGNVSLADPTNDFSTISLAGGVISVQDANALTVTSLTNGTNGAVTLVAGGLLDISALTAGIATGTSDLTLTSGTTLTTPGTLSGNNVALTGAGGLSIGNNVTATGTLGLTTTNSAITQTTGTITATGATTVAAGTGNVSLADPTNDFSTISLAGNAISVQDTSALTVTSLTNGPNGAVTLVAGGLLDISALTAGIATGAGNLTLTSGTTLTTPGPLSGSNVALTGASGLNLTQNVTATGTLGLTTTNAAITQTAGTIMATGPTTVAAGTGNVSLADPTNDFSTIAVTGGAVTLEDANALTVTSLASVPGQAVSVIAGGALGVSASINTGTASLTLTSGALLTTSGTLSGNNVALTGTGGLSIGNNVTATGTLGLTTTNAAITQTAGTITAAGATTVAAGTGNVSLADPTNDFSTISVAGNAISVQDANALTVTSLTNGTNGAVTLVAGGLLDISALTAGIATGTSDLTLTSGTTLTTPGPLTGTNVALTGASGLNLTQNVTATGTLGLTTTNAAITQTTGTITATGATTVAAGTGNVSLADPTNDFSTISLAGGAISVQDANGLAVTSLANGPNSAVTLVAGGLLDISALTAGIATGTSDLTLTSGTTLTTPGTLSGNNVTLTGTGGLSIGNNVTATGTLGLTTTNAAITQTAGTITATGATTVAAGTGNVSLADSTNDFSTIAVTGGAVTLEDANALTVTSLASVPGQAVSVIAGGALGVSAAINTGTASLTLTSGALLTTSGMLSGNNVALTGTGGLSIGNNVTATGTLGLTTTNAAITQTTGMITAAGATTVAAGTGNVSLANPNNDFSTISLAGGAISVQDANALTVTSLTNGPNGAVTLVAGGPLDISALTGGIATGAGNLTLTSGTTLTTPGPLSGTNVALTGASGLNLTQNVTATGALGLTTTNAAITQTTGTITVAGATTVAAGTGNVSLADPTNDFGTISLAGGAISVQDANGLAVTSLANGPNSAVTLVAGGMLDISALTGGIATGTGNLTLSSGTTLTTPGALSGSNLALTGASGLNLTQNVTATGALGLRTTNAAITQTAGTITAAGATTVAAGTGNVSLADPTNDFSTISLAGNAISVQDANALTVTSLANGTNGAVTLVAGGLLDISALNGGISTGSGSLTLTSGTTLTTPGALSGSNLALTGASGLNLAQNVTSTGTLGLTTANAAITQTAGTITATGVTTVAAGTGNVSLADSTNDFSTIAVTGGAVTLQDTNALSVHLTSAATATLTAGGALTVDGTVTGALNTNSGSDTSLHTLTATGGANVMASNGKVLLYGTLTSSGPVSLNGTAILGVGGLGALAVDPNQRVTLNTAVQNGLSIGQASAGGAVVNGGFVYLDLSSIISLKGGTGQGNSLSVLFNPGQSAWFLVPVTQPLQTVTNLADVNPSLRATTWFCNTNNCVNLDGTSTTIANAVVSNILNSAAQDAADAAFGTENLDFSIRRGYVTTIGRVPPGIDEIAGDPEAASCDPRITSPTTIKAIGACNVLNSKARSKQNPVDRVDPVKN